MRAARRRRSTARTRAVARLHVEHLGDEDDAGAEYDRPEHDQRVTDQRAALEHELAGRVRAEKGCEQQDDPRRPRDRIPVAAKKRMTPTPAAIAPVSATACTARDRPPAAEPAP